MFDKCDYSKLMIQLAINDVNVFESKFKCCYYWYDTVQRRIIVVNKSWYVKKSMHFIFNEVWRLYTLRRLFAVVVFNERRRTAATLKFKKKI